MTGFKFTLVLSVIGFLPVSSVLGQSQEPKTQPISKEAVWDVQRVTSPESVAELRAMQDRVKTVTKNVMDATVGLIIGPGAGSGVIVSEDGLVLTAAHVIGKPRQPVVFILSDGSSVRGISLGTNSSADSGMAKITGKPPKNAKWPGAEEGKWPFIDLGKSDELKSGQWVVAMGHPGGPKSQRAPPVRVGRYKQSGKFLSTDCTLVGGDSGGPLFDLDGKVIGIHSQIGFTLDINMHVPIDKFRTDWDRFVRGDAIGRRTLADLGLNFDKASKISGAKIDEIKIGGAAEDMALEIGDIVKKFNGNVVKNPDDLMDMLSSYDPGDDVTLTIQRNKQLIDVTMELGKRNRRR